MLPFNRFWPKGLSRHPEFTIFIPSRLLKKGALSALSTTFDEMYSAVGPPRFRPRTCWRAVPIALYSIRGERPAAVGQRLRHDLLFKWFLNLNIMEASPQFFNQVLSEAGRRRLLSDDHFAVDGTLLEAWASMKSFRPKDGSGDPPEDSGRNPTVDFQGERRINDTHASTTDPEAMLARKGPGREARLSFMGHVLMENRNRLAVDVAVTQATGTVERDAAADRHAGGRAWKAPHYGGSRQELQHSRLRADVSPDEGDASCSPEALLGHRHSDDSSPQLPA